MFCPSFETLAMFESMELDQQHWQEIEHHLTVPCRTCQQRLDWYRGAVSALREPLEAGPDELIIWARQLFLASPYAISRQPEIVFATLVFDSNANANARSGIRSAAVTKHERRLLYHANLDQPNQVASPGISSGLDIDIAIKCLPGANHYKVQGQLLFDQDSAIPLDMISVILSNRASQSVKTTTNRLGEFVFPEISDGEYNLMIKSDAWTVVIALPPVLMTKPEL